MAIDRAQMKECIAKILEGFEYYGELTNRKVREKLEQKMGLERDALKSEEATIAAEAKVSRWSLKSHVLKCYK